MRHPHPLLSKRISGFSLIEVLIALVILSVGLLGIAAMVATSLKSKDSSYSRTQAEDLAYNILDRMRANRATATSAGYDVTLSQPAGTVPSGDCTGTSANCTAAQIANLDIAQWKAQLANTLTSGEGSISTQIVNQYTQVTITIQWSDARAAQAVDTGNNTTAPAPTTLVFAVTSGL